MITYRVVTSGTFQGSNSSLRPIDNQFCHLPQELTGKIFTLVGKKDSLTIKLVCKSFRAISDYYQQSTVISKFDVDLVKRFPSLESIAINYFRRAFNRANNTQLESLEKLTCLLLKNPLKIGSLSAKLSDKVIYLEYRNTKCVWDSLAEIDRCRNLQTLVLSDCKIDFISKNLAHLRCLEIDGVKGITGEMIESIKSLPNLQLLSIARRYKSVSSDLSIESLSSITKMEKLRVLCLDNVEVSDDFVISLQTLKNLKILSLTNCPTISLLAVNFLFKQAIELMDFSNSVFSHQRGLLISSVYAPYNFKYHCANIMPYGLYENCNIDIFQKTSLTLSNDVLAIAMRHMKYLAPLIYIKDYMKSICAFDFRAKLIQNAPFLSVTEDLTLLKTKKHALILLTTPFPSIHGKKAKDFGVGVGSLVSGCDLPLRDDLEIIQAAISDKSASCLDNLKFASERIRSDFQSMLTLCRIDINALRYAHPQIQKQLYDDLVKVAGRSFGQELGDLEALSFYPELTKELASAIVECNGLDLQYLTLTQRAQADLVLLAILNNAAAIQFAFKMIHDFDFMKSALRLNRQALSFLPIFFQRLYLQMFCNMVALIEHADPSIQSDRTFCFWLIKKNCAIFRYLSPSLKDDEEIALYTVRQYPQMSEFTSFRLKQSLTFALNAILRQ